MSHKTPIQEQAGKALIPYFRYLSDNIKHLEGIAKSSPFYFQTFFKVHFKHSRIPPEDADTLDVGKNLSTFYEEQDGARDWWVEARAFGKKGPHQSIKAKLKQKQGNKHHLVEIKRVYNDQDLPETRNYIHWKKTKGNKTRAEQQSLQQFASELLRNPESQNGFCHNPKKGGQGIKIIACGESPEAPKQLKEWFSFEEPLKDNHLYMSVNTYELKMQLAAIRKLRHNPSPQHEGLMQLFATEHLLEDFNQHSIVRPAPDWQILTDESRDGTCQQRQFVQQAMETPDFAVLEGPPGSGKTTAISELVLQLLAQGKRILLSSATHVAIDNVLERLLELQKSGKLTELLAARIASKGESIANKEVKEAFWMRRVIKRLKEDCAAYFRQLSQLSKGQGALLEAFEKEDDFQDFVLQQCNLVAGTTVGILQHPSIKHPRAGFRDFDYLIVDEASKVTVQSFLVPAQFAKRWVLVGDKQQLSPYADDLLSVKYLAEKLEIEEEKASEMTSAMSEDYAYRLHPRLGESKHKELLVLLEDLSEEDLELVEGVRQVAYPSILEAFQEGISNRAVFDNRFSNIVNTGFSSVPTLDQGWQERFTSLAYQHRMTEEIAQIPREYFYEGNNLLTSKKEAERENPLNTYRGNEPSLVWQRVNKKGTGKKNDNDAECRSVMRELKDLGKHALLEKTKLKVAVLTFYRDQERLLRRKLRDYEQHPALDLSICTVDRFQGQEADAVLLCFTKWHGTPFYNVPNRLNVALTRARHKLVLFGNEKMKEAGRSEAIAALCDQVQWRD